MHTPHPEPARAVRRSKEHGRHSGRIRDGFLRCADFPRYEDLGRIHSKKKGYQFSDTNHLIFNLKKPMDRRGQAGRQMRAALDALNPKWLSLATLIPMPPSKVKLDPMYDDRLMQMLQVLGSGLPLDIREMIVQRVSTEAAHSTEARPRVDELCENYLIDESLVDPPPRVIGVIDDVLTTGSHFKAAQRVLRSRFPSVKIYGIFVARRVPDSGDITGF